MKIQKAGPADPSNARSEFRGSSDGVTRVVSASDWMRILGWGRIEGTWFLGA